MTKLILNSKPLVKWRTQFNKLPRRVRRTVYFFLVFTITFTSTGLFYMFNPWTNKPAEAVWFDDNWGYRKPVEITAHTTAENNVYITVTEDTATLITNSKLQSDCGDLRFTKTNGEILPYFINASPGCNNAATTIQVQFDSFPAGAQTIYMYYGNPNARDGFNPAAFSTAASGATVGSPGTEANAPSPRLYWKFDSVFNNTTGDSTINLFNGTVNNTPTLKPEDFCVAGKCLYFDGANNENVSKSDDAKLDFLAADNFTLSAWVKRNGISSANNVIINKASGNIGTTFQGYKLYMDTDGDFCFETRDGTLGLDQACTSSANFDDDKWHLVQGVKSGTASITLYVDGNQRATDASIASTGSLANAGIFYAGVDQDGLATEWLGYIDEVKVYPQARSAPQIQADFNARSNNEGASALLGGGRMDSSQVGGLSNGLVGYWKMDEGDWTNDCTATSVTDSSGNANNGKSCPLTTGPDPVAAKFGNAGNFDGTDDFVSIADNPVYELTNFSLSAWVNFDVLPSTRAETAMIAAKVHSVSPFYTYQFYINSSMQLCLQWNNTVPTNYVQCTTVSMNTGTWYHVAATKEGEFLKVFLNGADITGTATAATGTAFASDGVLALGAFDASNSRTDGKIDETRVYNRALTSADITNLYNFGPGPVGYWKFDEKTGTDALDSSDLGNHGTLTNGPTYINGKFGAAINFSSSTTDNDHVLKADDPDFDFIAGASFSWETYFKHAQTSTLQVMMIKFATVGFALYMETDGDITCYIDSSVAGTDTATSTLATYDDNAWHHAACVKDGNSSVKLYIDGVLVNSDTSISQTGTLENTGNLHVGITSDAAGNDWIGQLDEPKIYNYARTQAQVIEDVNAGHPAPGSPVGSSVAYWKFDEGYSTTANDSSAQNGSENLTLSAATAWTNSGKFNKAFNGGSNIRANLTGAGDDNDLDFTGPEEFSISFWFKSDSSSNPSAYETLFEKGPDNPGSLTMGYGIYTSNASDGKICFGIDDDTASSFPEDEVCTATDVYDANWHHFVVVKRGTSRIDMYIDGNPNGTPDTSISATGTLDTAFTVRLGDTNTTDGTDEFLGDIDELKVYRSGLTDGQVKLDMNRGASQVLGALSDKSGEQVQSAAQEYCVPGDSISCVAPVGRWDFEEGSGTAANDSSGNGNTGTLTLGPIWTTGKIGSAIDFDGNNDYVEVPNGASIKNTTAYTIEAWVKVDNINSLRLVYDEEVNDGAIRAAIYANNGSFGGCSANRFSFHFRTGAAASTRRDVCGSTAVSSNVWYHVAGVFDSINDIHYIYVNGRQDGSLSVAEGAVANTNPATTPDIGTFSNGAGEFWDGKIDAFRIFNYARTPAQIAWDYNRGAPVGHWKMDECQGTSLNDSSGNSNTGTITVGASGTYTSVGTCASSSASSMWYNGASGKRNYSLAFDGTDDYVTAGQVLPTDKTKPFTMAAWAYAGGAGSWRTIIGTGTSFAQIAFASDNTLRFGQNAGGGWWITGPSSSTATWYHVVGVYDGTNASLYVNGVLRAGPTAQTFTNASHGTTYIGQYSAGEYMNGQIDDARVYNYPLTATQVKNVMNDGATRFGPVTGAP